MLDISRIQLLQDLYTAEKQIEAGEGLEHSKARERVLEKLKAHIDNS